MVESKEHYKMYKDGKHWVAAKLTTVTAGVALFSTMVLGGMSSKANADTVNQASVSPTTTQVVKASNQTSKNAASANSTVKTPTAVSALATVNNSTQPNTKTSAVKSAQPTNLAANTQGTSTSNSQTSNSNNSSSASKNTGTQNSQPANSSSASQGTANQNSQPTNSSSASQSSGTQNNQPANSSSANQGSGTQNNQSANGIDVTVPHNDLDNAVNDAKNSGVQITQDPTKNMTADAGQPANDAEQQIKADYQNQIDNLKKAEQLQQQYNEQYQKELDAYHKSLENAGVKDFDQWQKDHPGVNPDGASSETVQNVFNLSDEPDSDCEVSDDGNMDVIKCPVKIAKDKDGKEFAYPDVSGITNLPASLQYLKGFPNQLQDDQLQLPIHGETDWHSKYIYIVVPKNNGTNVNGQVATFTYTNLKNTTYNGQPVSKIVVDYTDLDGGQKGIDYDNPGKDTQPTLWVASDFEEGMMLHGKSINVAVHLYDANGNEIKTNNDAYMTFGSISHNDDHQEYIKALNGDKMVAVKGSSIAVTDDGTLAEGDWGNNQVPGGLDDPHAGVFYGDSALLQSANNSNGFYFQFGANNKDDKATKGQWVAPCTTIPAAKPELKHATASYHYDDLKVTPVNVKDVAAGTVQGKDSVSINGKDVVQGQKITFTLNPSALPANRTNDTKSFQIVDKLDPSFNYTGYKAFLGNTDVTNDFTPALTKDANGQWTLTLTADSAFDDAINKDKSSSFAIPVFDLYGTALKGGTPIKNTYTEVINSNDWNSNTVSVTPENPGTPVKTVVNADGQDANNGNVARGDALIYHVDMDLTNQAKDTVLTPDTVAKGLWDTDKMPNGVTVNTSGIRVNSADGKDITDQFNITDENGQIKVAAKDPEAIIKAYGGTKLDITIPTTVNDNFTGDIKNTAQQNTFGNITTSNTVVDHVPPMNPTKDVIANLSDPSSLNGKSITLGSYFDYDLNSSTRSADYVGKTTEWGMQDHLDTKHDEFTGQWQVIADHSFVLQDGTTIKAGSDISKYFTMTYNTKTGEIDFEANKDFLDIMNLPANKKTAQGWTALFQCKRIAPGTVYNTFSETYNGKVKNSNTVKTTTPEPKKPEAPKSPATPQPQKVVEKATPAPVVEKAVPAQPVLAAPAPVKETPAPEKQAMPQTGESENDEAAILGLAALGVVGMMGLTSGKKRYE